MSEMSVDTIEQHVPTERHYSPELEKAVQTIVDAFIVDEADVDELRPQLWSAAEKVVARILEPEKRDAIAVLTEITDWLYFGRPDSPTPFGLISHNLAFTRAGATTLNTDVPYLNSGIVFASSEMARLGLEDVNEQMRDMFEGKKDEVEQAIKQIINGSSEYSLMMLFDEKHPEVVNGPLSPYWMTVRQSQIEYDVRARFGLGAGDPLTTEEEAKLDYRRRNHQLDYETMPAKAEPRSQPDAILRAAKYMMPFMAEAFERQEKEPMSEEYFYDEKDGCVNFRNISKDSSTEIYMFVYDAAHVMADAISSLPKELRFISEVFLKEFIELAFDPREARSIQDLLEEAADTAAAGLFSSMRSALQTYILHAPGDEVETFYKHDILTLLRDPNAPRAYGDVNEKDDIAWQRYSWSDSFKDHVKIATRSEYVREAWDTFGRVGKYGPANFRVPGRLVTMHTPKEPVPHHHDSPDILIEILTDRNYDEAPLIPGYKLVSRPSYNTYGFTVDKEGDPYSGCNAIVNAAARKKLAESYRSIGLTELADLVQNHSRMTVSELAGLIRINSEYYLPKEVSTYGSKRDDLPNDFYSTRELGDFKALVKDGHLRAQCDGFAKFMEKSLDLAFGQGSAGCVSGYVIGSQGGRISGVKHAQTIFTHKGKQYILDATPPSDIDMSRPEFIEGADYEKRRVGAYAVKLTGSKDIIKVEDAGVRRVSPETYEELLARTDHLLTEKLKVFFNTNTDEQLFKVLIGLPRSDPIRRAFELVVQLRSGRADPSQLESILNYVRDISNSDIETRRAMKIDQYNPSMLDDLSSDLHYLWWRARKEVKEK